MRIAIVTSQFDVSVGGGAARSAQLIANGLSTRGHEVLVVTTGRKEHSWQTAEGIRVQELAPRNLYWVGDKNEQPIPRRVLWQLIDAYNPFLDRRISRIFHEFAPDIVHGQKFRGLSTAHWVAAARIGIPVVQTCRDFEAISPQGTLSGRVGRMVATHSPLLWPYTGLRRRLSASVAAVTAPSSFALETVLRHRFFKHATSFIVPNSHGRTRSELDSAARAPAPQFGEALRVLFVGRLEPLKGVDMLCAAVSRLAAAGSRIELRVVGWGSQLESLRCRYGSTGAVRFDGSLFGEDLSTAYASSDLLVAPTIGPEVFGNVVVEALAHGTPALVSPHGGLKEIVIEGITGWILSTVSENTLYDRLEALCSRVDFVRLMRPSCHKRAELYSLDGMLDSYESIYRSIA